MDLSRPPAVAGTFYPANAIQLQQQVTDLLSDAQQSTPAIAAKALIVPHAGYIYSGEIAASAYACLQQCYAHIQRVVLLGPAHYVGFQGLAASSVDSFSSPLGNVQIDTVARNAVLALSQVKLLDAAHAPEHSLEVQLPFLQSLLQEFTLLPLLVGKASAQAVAEVLDTVWGNEETLILISSDLSHFYDYVTAQQIDAATTQAIAQLQIEGFSEEGACGHAPIRGLLHIAQYKQLKVEVLDVRNSGDTAGTKDRVVGYGAYAFY